MLMGAFFSVFCAFAWSFSIILWKKTHININPFLLNLGKNFTGLLLFLMTVFVMNMHFDIPFNSDFWLLALSGFLGIGLADGFVLKSIHYLPASIVAILETGYSPLVILFSLLFLGETLGPLQILGTALILGAVIYIQTPKKGLDKTRPENFLKGTLFMLVGLLVMALGIILMKPLLGKYNIFWIITVRMAFGVISSALLFGFIRNKSIHIVNAIQSKQKGMIFVSFITSAYIGILFWVLGLKYMDASQSAVLNQTSTIFTVILAAIFLKEKLTQTVLIAAGVATLGVMIIALS